MYSFTIHSYLFVHVGIARGYKDVCTDLQLLQNVPLSWAWNICHLPCRLMREMVWKCSSAVGIRSRIPFQYQTCRWSHSRSSTGGFRHLSWPAVAPAWVHSGDGIPVESWRSSWRGRLTTSFRVFVLNGFSGVWKILLDAMSISSSENDHWPPVQAPRYHRYHRRRRQSSSVIQRHVVLYLYIAVLP